MSNRLAKETSPYLLQHAENPVDWYPWGEEATSLARLRNKPILLSIGYSACHWCHVMERESFEDHTVAALEVDGRSRLSLLQKALRSMVAPTFLQYLTKVSRRSHKFFALLPTHTKHDRMT